MSSVRRTNSSQKLAAEKAEKEGEQAPDVAVTLNDPEDDVQSKQRRILRVKSNDKGVSYTISKVMRYANVVGIVIGMVVPLSIVALVTGNAHQAAGGTALLSGGASCLVAILRMFRQSNDQTHGIWIMGFGLYMTVPLCLLSMFFYYMTSTLPEK